MILADSDEVGQQFQSDAGPLFRFEAGQCSELMSATLAAFSWVVVHDRFEWNWGQASSSSEAGFLKVSPASSMR